MYYAIKQNNFDLLKVLIQHYQFILNEYLLDEVDVKLI